jgi:magnesium transporter
VRAAAVASPWSRLALPLVCLTIAEVLFGFNHAERERVIALREQDRFFWLDISVSEPSRDDLVEALGIPDGAVRALWGGDANVPQAFYADGESVVFALRCYAGSDTAAAGGTHRLRPLRVQVLVTGEYLLTLHEEDVSLPAALGLELPKERSRRYVVYAVLDGMLATTFRALEEVELTLDEVAERWSDDGGAGVPRPAVRDCTRRLATMRRWVGGQQTVFERVGVEIGALRGFEADQEPYFDRLDGQLDRLLDSIDAAANAMAMLLDLQLNERAYVVSVIATIFVPLTFITGFFGMNFGWMVDQISTQVAFWLLGLAIPIATGLLAWRLLVRRFLIGDGRQPVRR